MPSAPKSHHFSFSKSKRLTDPVEFKRVKNEGKAQGGALLVIGALRTGEENIFRAGFVTSKRIGGAVVRNRVRRRLRDIVRTQQARVAERILVRRRRAARGGARHLSRAER